MLTRTRSSAVAVAATLLLAVAVSSASGRALSVTTQTFRATWSSLEFTSAIVTIRCRTTIEGSFHSRTIAKVERLLVGAVTRAIIAHACTNGEAWFDNGSEAEPLGTAPRKLPYHLTYERFFGMLPAITGVGFLLSRISVAVRVNYMGFTCQARYGDSADNATLTVLREEVTAELTLIQAAGNLALVDSLADSICPGRIGLREIGDTTVLGSTNRITITLI